MSELDDAARRAMKDAIVHATEYAADLLANATRDAIAYTAQRATEIAVWGDTEDVTKDATNDAALDATHAVVRAR